MSAERPARLSDAPPSPSAETPSAPEADSLMSRLDSSPDGAAAERPSAAELLGGRGRRRRTIRVPDDAVPAGTPPAPRKSVPPPFVTSAQHDGLIPPPPVVVEPPPPSIDQAIRPSRIVSIGLGGAMEPSPSSFVPSTREPAPTFGTPPPVEPSPLAAASEATSSPEATSADAHEPLAAPLAPSERPPTPPHGIHTFLGGTPLGIGDAPVAPLPPLPSFSGVSPVTASAPVVIAAPPVAVGEQKLPTSTLPSIRIDGADGLHATVREALAMLDRESDPPNVEIGVEVPVEIQEAVQRDSETDAILDTEVEEIAPQPKRSAPVPPPRKGGAEGAPASFPPSAPGPSSVSGPISVPVTERPVSQPPLVTAAASTVQSVASSPAIQFSPPPTGDPAAEIKKRKKQWFEELFNDDYARTMPKVAPKYLEREVGFIDESLGCEKGATILDLGCGPGEQAVQLAKRGYEVIGVDLSLAMLARAADEAAEHNQRINFVQGDMRELVYEDAFDGVYCWGTTFGYFDEQKNAEVIDKVHRALRRGGRFLLDVANRDFIVSRVPSMQWFEGDGCVCMDDAQMNAITSRLQIKRTLMMEDGRQRELDYSIRLYSLHELGKLLHDHGFRVAECSGDISTPGTYFGAESPRIVILAEKR